MTRSNLIIALGTAALCAAVMAVPVGASVGKHYYEGPAATQGVDGRSPSVRVKIEFKKVNGKRGKPKAVIDFQHRAIALFCANGTKTHTGPFYGDEGGPAGFSFFERTGLPVKKGRFKLSENTFGSNVADVQRATGRVGRKGNATGTIQLTLFHPVFGTCDSGVVNWTASPVGAYSKPVIPPCANLGTCPP